MPPALSSSLVIAGAYLLGSVPFAWLLGRLKGLDIRELGSGNIGATNLARAMGRRWAIPAFLLDFSKGLLPVVAANHLVRVHPEAFALGEGVGLPLAVGLAAILGHIFPIFLAFRGGKGVATTFGVMAGLSILATLAAALVWLAVYASTRTVSIASLASAVALPIAVAILEHGRSGQEFFLLEALVTGVALLVLWRHRGNIRRLLKREELTFR